MFFFKKLKKRFTKFAFLKYAYLKKYVEFWTFTCNGACFRPTGMQACGF